MVHPLPIALFCYMVMVSQYLVKFLNIPDQLLSSLSKSCPDPYLQDEVAAEASDH